MGPAKWRLLLKITVLMRENERSRLFVTLKGKGTMLANKSVAENGITAVEDDNNPVLEQMDLVTRVIIHDSESISVWDSAGGRTQKKNKKLTMIHHLNH